MHFCMGDSLVTVVLKMNVSLNNRPVQSAHRMDFWLHFSSYVLPTSPLYFIIVEEESTKPASQKQSGEYGVLWNIKTQKLSTLIPWQPHRPPVLDARGPRRTVALPSLPLPPCLSRLVRAIWRFPELGMIHRSSKPFKNPDGSVGGASCVFLRPCPCLNKELKGRVSFI